MHTMRDKVLEQLRVLDKHAHCERQGFGTAEGTGQTCTHYKRQGLGTAVGTGQTHMHFERQGLGTAEGTEALEQLWVLDRHVHTLRDKAWNS